MSEFLNGFDDHETKSQDIQFLKSSLKRLPTSLMFVVIVLLLTVPSHIIEDNSKEKDHHRQAKLVEKNRKLDVKRKIQKLLKENDKLMIFTPDFSADPFDSKDPITLEAGTIKLSKRSSFPTSTFKTPAKREVVMNDHIIKTFDCTSPDCEEEFDVKEYNDGRIVITVTCSNTINYAVYFGPDFDVMDDKVSFVNPDGTPIRKTLDPNDPETPKILKMIDDTIIELDKDVKRMLQKMKERIERGR